MRPTRSDPSDLRTLASSPARNVIPPILLADDARVSVPRRLVFGAAAQEAVYRQIDQRFFPRALDGMQGVRRNPDNVSRLDGKFFSFRANAQNSAAFQDIKNLLGIIVLVQRRRFARFNDDDKDLRSFGICPVHDQIIDMRRKLVPPDFGCWKNKFHVTVLLNQMTEAANFSPTGWVWP
jgi:hypothetical protein